MAYFVEGREDDSERDLEDEKDERRG